MGFFGKKSKSSVADHSLAETELASNTTASKMIPLLVENSYSEDQDTNSRAMIVDPQRAQSLFDIVAGAGLNNTQFDENIPNAPDPELGAHNIVTTTGAGGATTGLNQQLDEQIPIPNNAPDPELGTIVPFGSDTQKLKSHSQKQLPQNNKIQAAAAAAAELKIDNNVPPPIPPAASDDGSAAAFVRIMQAGPLPNPETLVMGQLIQWKFAAEEGSMALRIPAVLGALALMVTALYPFVLESSNLTKPGHVIISYFVLGQGLVICIIDGRSNYARDPLGSRAKLRNFVMRHLNVLRLVWGRGLLYGAAGLLNMAHEITVCTISGAFMVGLGIIAMISGYHASKNLNTLRKSLSDDTFLWMEFLKHANGGFLNPSEFAQFIWDLGLEVDDLFTLKAFNTIDVDHDNKITFREFSRWWSQVRL